MSGPPFLLDDLSQSLGHRHHQLPQIIIIHQLQTQQLHYLSLSLLHVLGTGVPQFHLHPGPDVFFRIQVWTVYSCSVSRWRPHKVDKRMVLEYTHGLFIT